ncbi:hypothetical protein GGG16DRAFT_113853 [Schizophyllum commune]
MSNNPYSQQTQSSSPPTTDRASTEPMAARPAASRKRRANDAPASNLAGTDTRKRARYIPSHATPLLTPQNIVDNQGIYEDKVRERDAADAVEDDALPTSAEIAAMSPEDRAILATQWENKQYEKAVAFRPYERDHGTYEAFKRIVGVDTLNKKRAAGGAELKDWLDLLDAGCSDGRSHDTYKMIPLAAQLVNTTITDPKDRLSEGNGADMRSGRGVQNDYTGYFLSDIANDLSTPEGRVAMREGKNQTFFIRMMYEKDGYDVQKVRKNYTKSPYLVAAFRCLFLSPTEASSTIEAFLEPERPTKRRKRSSTHQAPRRKSPAAKVNMQTVSPRNIAYTACQLRVALTDAHAWSMVYDGFNYLSFFNFIVDFFEGPFKTEERREDAQKILEWWNEQIFPAGDFQRMDGQDIVSRSRALLDAQD